MEKDIPGAHETARLEWPDMFSKTSKHQFEQILNLIRLHYGVDAAFFSLAGESGQRIRASQGLGLEKFQQASALCDVLIQQDVPLVVPDVNQEERFGDHSGDAAGQALIRFYAGVPVRAAEGRSIGALCLSDMNARQMGHPDLEVLRAQANLIEDALANWSSAEESRAAIKTQRLTRAISHAQNIFLTTDDDHAAFDALLDDLLTLSECAFGFIGEVLHNESDQAYVKVRSITNISWNEETARLYDEVNRRGMIFDRLDTLIGAAVVSRDVVISENVHEDKRKGGTPSGHPPISTYIGIPVFSGTNLVGLIGLANRPGGFSRQFAQDLEPLTRTVGTLIERKRLYAERIRQHEHTERAANFDLLTGLPNRRLFNKLFDEKIREASIKGYTLSVCFIDLDGFKEINDRYGHETGDTVLKNVAKRLSNVTRDADVVARFSGDEFVALFPNVKAPSLYKRVLECIGEPISHHARVIKVSGSMGITLYPDDNSNPDVLVRHADQAMYAAKELGKNQFSFFDVGRHRSRREKHRIIDDFQRALSENELELFYQPKIDLNSSRVAGFEALIRWHHPKEGLLTPYRFLPALAGSEQEIQLGEYVISEGVKTIQHFAQIGADYSLSINISAQHILNDGFLTMLKGKTSVISRALRETLCIEVLESMALKDIDRSVQILAECKRIGLSLSLDDFGTGFSSLSYFRQLPVDEVKIDKSFVMEILNNTNDRLIAQNIISLAKSFNRKVVGEGVETIEISEELIKMGCDYAQGYYFSPPLPLREALKWSKSFDRQ